LHTRKCAESLAKASALGKENAVLKRCYPRTLGLLCVTMTTIKVNLLRVLGVLALAGLILAQGQGGRDIPPFGGDGNSDHDGQPSWCQARDVNGYKKNCGICDTKCENGKSGEEDGRCKTYCRKGKCLCHPDCTSHLQKDPTIKAGASQSDPATRVSTVQ
jgi:hypothetical protein